MTTDTHILLPELTGEAADLATDAGRGFVEQVEPVVADAEPMQGPATLRGLFWTYRWRILLTYALFNLENVLMLAQPFVLGLAIDGLLRTSYLGITLFAVQHVAYTIIGSVRRMYDTRAFTGIYADLATRLVVEQRDRGVEVSRVAARSGLSRVFVDFFEHDLTAVFASLYAIVGALIFLTLYDPILLPMCVLLLGPACVLNTIYSRKTLFLNRRLNDEFEREVSVIAGAQSPEVQGHYRNVARWRIKLSDWEAITFSVMELFVLGLMAAALMHFCSRTDAYAGDIFAVFRYVLMFVTGLDSVPLLVQQVSRLRDISRRIRDED